MSKKRAIVSYDKLSIEQKKQLLVDFPDGFSSGMTQIKTPTGETLDALLWETEEIIYLIKLNKPVAKAKSVDDDEEDFDDELPEDDVKGDEEDIIDDEAEDEYDVADEDDGEDAESSSDEED